MAQMFAIETSGQGRLWIMPCPDGAALEASVQHYRSQGAGYVVSMLASDEAAQLGLSEEAALCAAEGLQFLHHPIPDFGLPEAEAFYALVLRIRDLVDSGAGVAVHCRAGIGRSGMVTAGVLIAQGLDAAQATRQVAHARGVSIPDTVEQATFLAAFHQRHFG